MELTPEPITTPPPAERQRKGASPMNRRRKAMDTLTIGEIINRNKSIYYQFIAGIAVALLICLAFVAKMDAAMVWPCALISAAALVSLWFWSTQDKKGVPILPTFVVQQLLVYLMPIFVQNTSIQGYNSAVINSSAMSVGLFFLVLPLGWKTGREMVTSQPSRWILNFQGHGGTGAITLRFALLFLGINIAFEVLSRLGLMGWIPTGLMPVARAILSALAAFGAFLGGFVIADRRGSHGKVWFWIVFYLLLFLTASGLLLSGVTLMVVAAGIGLGLGGTRIPWLFMITVCAILGFLNLGKFEMRAKYWGENSVGISLSSIPSLYTEWTKMSYERLGNRSELPSGSSIKVEDKGQSLLERMNNLQNMTFVINAQETLRVEPLWGKTYALIPPLFIPRFLWHDKPRTHEGQILLNLHYGRQRSVEDTEKTYIAWGFLPEAVGNFGTTGGPLFLGSVIGLLFGMLESWSTRKRLFSIEGLVIVGLLLQTLVSFEMVASVFLTSTLQMIIVLAVGAQMFRMSLAAEQRF